MWTLECDSPIFENKRIWLRPGKKYLFGRHKDELKTSKTGNVLNLRYLQPRKHLTISVSPAKPGDGSSVHTRSEVKLEDEKTKFGTEIDGQRVTSGASSILNKEEHTFRLGKTSHLFRIKWHPVVLCVSFSSKENKTGKDPLGALRTRLEDTDTKVALNYIINKTTHVVQSKRNTAKGLQALINGKYIVTESFIDALIYATTPTDLDYDESLSPLEEDFDKNWPDAMQHVPPKGKEPHERPVEAFAPNPERGNVFEGYTFVFCDKGQFESLQPPITNGGGKAFLFKLKSIQTTTEELVGYVKNVAGEEGLGELEDGSEGKGVVVIKFRGGKDDFDWAAELGREASLALDLRFIEQNEFMDAILMNDASVLRRPLKQAEDDDMLEDSNRVAMQNGTMQAIHQPEPEISQPPPPPRRQRGLIKSRFKGFSDDDDDDVKPSLSSIPIEESQPQSRLSQRPNTQASYLNDSPSQPPTNPRKRPALPEEDEEDLFDALLPAATAMKRRRLEEARLRGESPSTSFQKNDDNRSPTPSATTTSAKKPRAEEIDIKKSLRERRVAADEAAAQREESLHQGLADTDIEALRNLAVVEEFDIMPRSHSAYANGNDVPNPRWDPAWNGRKNFKKFRRQGEDGARQVRRGGQGVIVPLEEVKRKGLGIGEEYWLESSSASKRKRRERESQGYESQMESLETGSAERGKVGKGKGKEKAVKNEVPRELKMEMDDEDVSLDAVNVEAPRRTRGMDSNTAQTRTQQSSAMGIRRTAAGGSKTGKSGSGFAGRGKRAFEPKEDEDESEEDELKFRFGKRRRPQH
ncbi:MAG: hypothetical protein Q9181_003371 [Wetmoreana brouardii]